MASKSPPIYNKSQSLSSLESQTFQNKASLDFPRSSISLDGKEIHSVFNTHNIFKFPLDHTTHKNDTCNCPHILVADDDGFQHLYYQSLFQKSLDFDGIYISRENLRLHLCFSGEELIKKFTEIKECGCSELLLIITDYQMGLDKLDGVKTSTYLREAGYIGPLILRTSESQEYLKEQHDDFGKLIEMKIISDVLDKSDIQNGKETIQIYLQRISKDHGKF